jgi:hypothetical protein
MELVPIGGRLGEPQSWSGHIAYDVGNWDIHLMLNINVLYRKGVTRVVVRLENSA